MRLQFITLLCSAALPLAEAAAGESPYAGEERRAIKALSAAEIEALQTGGGAGYAKAAELNGWPGPKHVLELANELGLTESQRAASQALYTEMQNAAIRLGERLLLAERELEALFGTASPSAETIHEITARIAQLDGELRALHLAAHVKQTGLLDAQQVRHYSRLRGYGATTHDGAHQH